MVSYEVATESTMYYCLFLLPMILAIGFLRYGFGTITCYKQQPGGPQDAGTGGKQANRVRQKRTHHVKLP